MKKLILSVVALAVAFAVVKYVITEDGKVQKPATKIAQKAKEAKKARRGPRLTVPLRRMDIDNNGEVTRKEYQKFYGKKFDIIDVDRDGTVTGAEARAARNKIRANIERKRKAKARAEAKAKAKAKATETTVKK